MSRSGASSSISSADGAGAGDDLRIVERVDEDIAVLERSSSRALAISVVEHRAVQHDPAPWPWVCVTFMVGVGSGITIIAGMPSLLA